MHFEPICENASVASKRDEKEKKLEGERVCLCVFIMLNSKGICELVSKIELNK